MNDHKCDTCGEYKPLCCGITGVQGNCIYCCPSHKKTFEAVKQYTESQKFNKVTQYYGDVSWDIETPLFQPIGKDGLIIPKPTIKVPTVDPRDEAFSKCAQLRDLRFMYFTIWDLASDTRGFVYIGTLGPSKPPPNWKLGKRTHWLEVGTTVYLDACGHKKPKLSSWAETLDRRAMCNVGFVIKILNEPEDTPCNILEDQD